jgi:hypothetical protein
MITAPATTRAEAPMATFLDKERSVSTINAWSSWRGVCVRIAAAAIFALIPGNGYLFPGNPDVRTGGRSVPGTISSGGDETVKTAGPPGGVGLPCKDASPSDGDEAYKGVDPSGNGRGECEGFDPSDIGGGKFEVVDPSGNVSGGCKGVDPSDIGGGKFEVVDPSCGGGEECEGVGMSESTWPRPFDMTATFRATTGTALSSRASYISRTTGAPSTRLKMDRRRSI